MPLEVFLSELKNRVFVHVRKWSPEVLQVGGHFNVEFRKKLGLLRPWAESTPILYIPTWGVGYHSHFSDEYYEALSVIISSLYNKLRLEQIYPLRHVAYAAFEYSAFSCFFGQLKLGGIYHSICLKSKSSCDEGCGDGLSLSVLKSKYSRYEMIIPKQEQNFN